MRLKIGIIYGVLIWIITHLVFSVTHPIIDTHTSNSTFILFLFIIIVSGFFSILYIREINKNEVLEGLLGGIIFAAIDIILDLVFFVIPNNHNILISNYTTHFILISVMLIIIPTFLGYLAQMNIELK